MGQPDFLSSKFVLPKLNANILHRRRLWELLEKGLKHKLVLISAPAGFGKTSLISEWITQNRRKLAFQFSWLSIDTQDDIELRFWQYFTRSLQSNRTEMGQYTLQLLETTPPVPVSQVITSLLNDLSDYSSPVVIVLDNYHLITTPNIHEGMIFLISHLPPHVHLFILTRSDPPWPLSGWRISQDMLEIRRDDLRFQTYEVEALFQSLGIMLSVSELQAIEEQIDGWAAALQLLVLSLQSGDTINNLLEAFKRSDHFLTDYLLEEILNQLEPELREFLLKTSIFERLEAKMCDYVLARNDSEIVLKMLCQKNLFLAGQENALSIYHFHPMFAELLVRQLHLLYPNQINILHQRASQWYQRNGLIHDAIQHAIRGADFNQTAKLIETNIIVLKEHGDLQQVERWLEVLPDQIIAAHPWLYIARGWTSAYLGDADGVDAAIREIELILRNESSASKEQLLGHVFSMRSYMALFEGDFDSSIASGTQAIQHLPDSETSTRISTLTTLASALRMMGDLKRASQVIREALRLNRRNKNCPTTIHLLCAQAAIHQIQGQLPQAIATLENAISLATYNQGGGNRVSPWAGHAYVRLSRIHLNRLELDDAFNCVMQGIALSEKWGNANAIWEGYRNLSLIMQDMGNLSASREALQNAETVSQRIAGRLTSEYTLVYQVQQYIHEDNLQAARNCIDLLGLDQEGEINFHEYDLYAVWAYYLIADGKAKQALLILENLLAILEKAGAASLQISAQIFIARAYQALGNESRAAESLYQAISLAKPLKQVKDFVDEGQSLWPVLQNIARKYPEHAAFIQIIAGHLEKRWGLTASSPLAESLSEREKQVLRLLGTSASVEEIAGTLGIAVSTTRTHIRNIYAKMQVNRRIEALHRAREAGVIEQ